MKGLNSVFPASVQREVRNQILIKTNKVKALFHLGMKHTDVMDSNDFRHQGTNYDSITHSDWYLNLKEVYGEAIHIFLKYEITNRINSVILNLSETVYEEIRNEFKAGDLQLKTQIRSLKETLESEKESYLYEIEQLNNRVQSLEKDNVGLSSTVAALIEQANKTIEKSEAASAKIQKLTTELTETKVELTETKVELTETKEKVTELQEMMEEIRNPRVTREDIENIRRATEMLLNSIRKTSVDLTEIEDELTNSIVDARAKTEMLGRVVESREFVESLVDFTLAIEEKHKVNVTEKLLMLDALILQANRLESKLKEIKHSLKLKLKH
jgi:chromosome segregation ATPase